MVDYTRCVEVWSFKILYRFVTMSSNLPHTHLPDTRLPLHHDKHLSSPWKQRTFSHSQRYKMKRVVLRKLGFSIVERMFSYQENNTYERNIHRFN